MNDKLQEAIDRQANRYVQVLKPYRRTSKFSIRVDTKQDAEDYALILSNVPKLLQYREANNELIKQLISMNIELIREINQLATDLKVVRDSKIVLAFKEGIEGLIKHITDGGGGVAGLKAQMTMSGNLESEEHTANSTEVDSESRRSEQLNLKFQAMIDLLETLGLSVEKQQELEEDFKQSSETKHSNYQRSKHKATMKFQSGTIQPGSQLREQVDAKIKKVKDSIDQALGERDNKLGNVHCSLEESQKKLVDLERRMNKRTTKFERGFFYVASLGFLIYIFLHLVLRIL